MTRRLPCLGKTSYEQSDIAKLFPKTYLILRAVVNIISPWNLQIVQIKFGAKLLKKLKKNHTFSQKFRGLIWQRLEVHTSSFLSMADDFCVVPRAGTWQPKVGLGRYNDSCKLRWAQCRRGNTDFAPFKSIVHNRFQLKQPAEINIDCIICT